MREACTSAVRQLAPTSRLCASPDASKYNSFRVAAGGVAAAVWWSSRQEVPYTHRMHAVLVPLSVELELGDLIFQRVRFRSSHAAIMPAAAGQLPIARPNKYLMITLNVSNEESVICELFSSASTRVVLL